MFTMTFSGLAVTVISHSGAALRRQPRWLLMATLLLSTGVGGCVGSTPSISPTPTQVETSDGPFHLTFQMPKTTWGTAEAIEGNATLSLSDEGSATISGSSQLIVFGFAEIGGSRKMGPLWTTDCGGYQLDAGKPVTTSLTRSGSWQNGGPDASFYSAFFTDPQIQLTPGDWTITAESQFTEGPVCQGPQHTLTVSIQVHITS